MGKDKRQVFQDLQVSKDLLAQSVPQDPLASHNHNPVCLNYPVCPHNPVCPNNLVCHKSLGWPLLLPNNLHNAGAHVPHRVHHNVTTHVARWLHKFVLLLVLCLASLTAQRNVAERDQSFLEEGRKTDSTSSHVSLRHFSLINGLFSISSVVANSISTGLLPFNSIYILSTPYISFFVYYIYFYTFMLQTFSQISQRSQIINVSILFLGLGFLGSFWKLNFSQEHL